jgi:hypothetical protein
MIKWDDLNRQEKRTCVSLFPEQAKQDDDEDVRLMAYELLGFTEQAELDTNWLIRLHAYQAFGFTKEALLYDESEVIKKEAEIYFKIKNKLEGKDKSDDQSKLQIIKETYEKLKKYLGE